MGSLALLPAGYLIAGPLGEAVGAREVLIVGPAIAVVALASGLLVPATRTLRRDDTARAGDGVPYEKSATPSSGVDAVA